MEEFDFPANPTVNQEFIAPTGARYQWDGYAWVAGNVDTISGGLGSVGGFLTQVRILLQDTDASSGSYRYTTESLLLCLNQGFVDMYRVRPDIFLANKFVIPSFTMNSLGQLIPIEMQYISPLIYYVVGLAQARDDEQTQDSRAMAFVKTFQSTLLTVA